MARADIGSAYNAVPSHIPQGGKVGEDDIESEGKMSSDIFEHDKRGSKYPQGDGDVGPEVALIVGSFALAGVAETAGTDSQR